MDLKLPIVNGWDATKEIKRINPTIKIIAQTAYATDDEMRKSKEAGCDDFIAKPYIQADFEKLINKYLS